MGKSVARFFSVPELAKMLGMSRFCLGTELKKTGIPIRQRGGPRTRRLIWLSDMERYWPEAWASLHKQIDDEDDD